LSVPILEQWSRQSGRRLMSLCAQFTWRSQWRTLGKHISAGDVLLNSELKTSEAGTGAGAAGPVTGYGHIW